MKALVVIAAVPTLLLLDIGIAVTRGGRLGREDVAVVAAAALVLMSLGIAAASRAGRSFLLNHGANLVYVVLSAVGAWIVAEVIAAGFLYYGAGVNPFTSAPPFHTRPAGQHLMFLPGEEAFPGIVGVSHYTTNSKGLRGPEFPPRDAAYRILTVGGSTTECTYLDDTETWQHLLLQRLNHQDNRQPAWIGSAGISGLPTFYHLRFVTDSPLMQQIDAVIFLIGANDFNRFVRGDLPDGMFHPKPQPIWRYSPIVGMVSTWWRRRERSLQAEDVAGQNIILRRRKRQKARIVTRVVGLDDALQQYERRVEAIVNETRGHGLRPILVTQPTLWDENLGPYGRSLLWLGDLSDDEYLSVEAGRDGIDKHNDVLMRVCERMEVECISTASMHGQERFYYDDFHFNESGAAELARIIGDHLTARATAR